jgi:hypothetical protein
MRNIESNTGKSARQGNLTRGCRRFHCLALFAGVWFYFSLFSAVFSFVFVYVLLADDHVNNVSYFSFMSIKKVVSYFCVLRACTSARKKNHVRFTGKCMLYSYVNPPILHAFPFWNKQFTVYKFSIFYKHTNPNNRPYYYIIPSSMLTLSSFMTYHHLIRQE